jgi:hypothetical protein
MNTRLIHGLLWREWLLHRGELTWIFSAWLFGIWVFPIHPIYFLIPFGVLSAVVIAPTFGGSDAAEGSEEFSFSLPPTRTQRFLVRMGLGGGTLSALLIAGVLAGLFDLPQKVWGIVFDSGFTVPFSPVEHGFVYGLACLLPMAIFSDTFVAGSSCRNPEGTGALWLRGLFFGGVVIGISFLVESFIWKGHLTGWISCPVLGLWALLRLAFGYRDYKYKEGVSGLPRLVARGGSYRWIVLAIVLVLVVLLALAFFWAGSAPALPPAPMRDR